MEKITIIIPVYNAQEYIKRCIESALEQTYENLEILVIIDGATDKSIEIVKEYAKKDERIRLINRENKGIFYTRVEGIKEANSNYLYFLDADDWLEKNAIQTMYNYKEKYHTKIVRCQNYYKDEIEKIGQLQSIEYLQVEDFNKKLYPQLFGSYDFASIWNQLIEKSCLKDLEENDYDISFGEDYLLNLKLYKNIESIVLVPDYLYHYRTNQESITNQQNYEGLVKKLEGAYKSHLEIINRMKQYENIEEKEKYEKITIFRAIRAIKNRMIELVSYSLRNDKQKEAYAKIEEILKRKELRKLCQEITPKELLTLAKQENHKYVIKNIRMGKTKKVLYYIKFIYMPGKKIKNRMRR